VSVEPRDEHAVAACERQRLGRRAVLRGGCLAAGVAAAAVTIDGTLITPARLVTSDHAFGRTAASGRPLRLLQLSDLHLHGIGGLERMLLERIHDSRADLIVLTGDAIDSPDALPHLEQLLRELPTATRRLAILGNWEHKCGIALDDLRRTYERQGVEMLVNRSVDIEHHGRWLTVTGLDDLVLGRPDPTHALAGATRRDQHLVLAHCPAARDALGLPPGHPASLVLSGHTHGGQIAPLGAAFVRPRGSGRYVAGWYRDGGPPMYVSRGIGTSLLPVRIGATPELVRIEWWL
jgi:predicted MPP superfamily phosphohydrolase